MIVDPATVEAIEYDVGRSRGRAVSVDALEPVAGGCIHRALRLRSGRESWFVKLTAAQRRDLFEAEAHGLLALAAQSALVIPGVVCHGSDDRHAWLILDWLDLVPLDGGTAAALGEGLATMHAIGSAHFGFDEDNWLGSTRQGNSWTTGWIEFVREHRLLPQWALARAKGAGGALLDAVARVIDRLSDLLGDHAPRPSLVHGDLWSGNAAATRDGRPAVFDPAPYFGDGETDLALAELFGGFPPEFRRAYRDASAVDDGYPIRRDVYQLYHVLNHFNLFGGGYEVQALALAGRLAAGGAGSRAPSGQGSLV